MDNKIFCKNCAYCFQYDNRKCIKNIKSESIDIYDGNKLTKYGDISEWNNNFDCKYFLNKSILTERCKDCKYSYDIVLGKRCTNNKNNNINNLIPCSIFEIIDCDYFEKDFNLFNFIKEMLNKWQYLKK